MPRRATQDAALRRDNAIFQGVIMSLRHTTDDENPSPRR